MRTAVVLTVALTSACAAPGEPGSASSAAPLALSPDGRSLWVVNPDADSVTRVDLEALRADPPVPVGREPWCVAVTPTGTVLTVNRADGTLSFVDGRDRFDLEVGPEPGGLALSAAGDVAYVTVSSADEIAVIDLPARRVARRIAVGRLPWAVAVAADDTVVVSHRRARLAPAGGEARDDGKEAWVTLLRDAASVEVTISPREFGFPNGLEGVAVHDDTAYVAHLLDAPGLPRRFDRNLSGGLAAISLSGARELSARKLHLNDPDFSTPVHYPRAVALAPDGRSAYVVLAGTDAVMGIDLERSRLIGFWPVGRNPRGMVVDAAGGRGYVMNYLSRDLSVLDLADTRRRPELARVALVEETLAPEILRGKVLFNSASDPRLARLGWMSCAGCHFDGGVDGTTWLTPDGPRQTQPLWRLDGTAPFHASATRDEIADFEVDIETAMGGVGLAPGPAPRELGAPATRSEDLEALAAFVLHGIRVPRALPPADEASISRGRTVFENTGCSSCHGGPHFTSSQLPGPPGSVAATGALEIEAALRDVGTATAADVLGARGFDVPTLLGLHASAPFLHDGSAATLEEVLDGAGHTGTSLDAAARADLVAYLRSISR